MKQRLLALVAVLSCAVASAGAADFSQVIKTLRAVGPEGKGNAEAAKAWQSLARADAKVLPMILEAMDGASPLAANWLRAAVDAIAGRAKVLPVAELQKFLQDRKHNPRARRLAFELIRRVDEARAVNLIPDMLNDPSVELRRDAVDRVIEAAQELSKAKKDVSAKKEFRQALAAARDIDQIKTITTQLRQLKETVDLPQHFGFLMHWQVIGPFDNTGRKGHTVVYPPEKEVKLDARYRGKTGPVGWSKFVTADEYGMVDINKAYPGMLKEVTAYAYTVYEATDSRDVELRLGCKNAWKIWLNGKLVFERDEYHRGTRIDHYQLKARLRKGPNTLLVKLGQNEQTQPWTKEWRFQLRICDSTGTALLAANRPATPQQGTDNGGTTPKPRKKN